MAGTLQSLGNIGREPQMANQIVQALIESTGGGAAPARMPAAQPQPGPVSSQAQLMSPEDLPYLDRLFRGQEMPFDVGGSIKSGIGLSRAPALGGMSRAASTFVDKISKLMNSGQSHRVGWTFATKFLDEMPVVTDDLPKIEAALRPALSPKKWEMIKTALDSKIQMQKTQDASALWEATRSGRGLPRKTPPPGRQEGIAGDEGILKDFIP